MSRKRRKMVKEHCYVSYTTHGVDATEFYKKFNVTIAGVGRAVGVCRESVSKVPIEGASHQNTTKIISYLEEVSIEDYLYMVRESKEKLIATFGELEAAWNAYEKKELILNYYRNKYYIPRKKEIAEKVTEQKLLESLEKKDL